MDKASIVGDAVAYVQELQSQAKKLKADIAGLEASLTSTGGYQEPTPVAQKSHTFRSINPPVSKKINQVLNPFFLIIYIQNLVYESGIVIVFRTKVGNCNSSDSAERLLFVSVVFFLGF